LVCPGVKFKSVEGDSLLADRNFGEAGPDFGVEAVTIHAEIKGRIPKPDEPRQQH
jgi:hypothetical protein